MRFAGPTGAFIVILAGTPPGRAKRPDLPFETIGL
ncbi:hypothetical protein AvCA_24780 [Azotobacter vinelandii CA]|uniref:Uncharacterized protein n=2 Tax=Azotobacter vinelandii TaxID=354 RepID=C1DII1_AZOVD|nr:hypothetical protein Avin_24780 [Azotobacter vinelandii DJ]AGK16672.1 hypothetical protein AvCA_24780 [Azotobacter vinelandii CA]AGK20640.1 hypothetical protein AvCA6_24780 [Azotobacter vinelandii CA6]